MITFNVDDTVTVSEELPCGMYKGFNIPHALLQFIGKKCIIEYLLPSEKDSKHRFAFLTPCDWDVDQEMKNATPLFPIEFLIPWEDKEEESMSAENKEPSKVILGVAPDVPVVTNESGGKQSDTPYAFHMLPTSALFAAAGVAKYGADKYGETIDNRNYIKIPTVEHVNHAVQHLIAYLAGDEQDDHLAHAIVRCMFAFDTDRRERSA